MTAQELIHAILTEMGSCSKVKLAKIFLFIERSYYRTWEESLTGSYYVRLQRGPVPANFDDILKEGEGTLWTMKICDMDIPGATTTYTQHKYEPISAAINIPQPAQDIIHEICSKVNNHTSNQLSEISHQLPAWMYSDPGEPLFIEELVLDNKEEYFQLIDKVNEMESDSEDIPEEILALLS